MPMKIAQVAPLYEAVSPTAEDAIARLIGQLTDALVDMGHDVTLFATADSLTRAQLVAVRDRGLRLDTDVSSSDTAAHLVMLDEVRRRAWQFDVLHFHVELLHLPMFADLAAQTLTTLHGRVDVKDLYAVYNTWPNFPLVSMTDEQRNALPQANWVATVAQGPARQMAANYLALYCRAKEIDRSPSAPSAGFVAHCGSH
jgi:hypothetical protein